MLDIIDKTIVYLRECIGLRVLAEKLARKLPAYLRRGVDAWVLHIEGLSFLGMAYAEGSFGLVPYRKHAEELGRLTGLSPIAILPDITPYQRRVLVSERIPFVVPGRQLYIPALGAVFEDGVPAGAVEARAGALAPVAQVMLLHLIYRGTASPILQTTLAEELGIGAMGASRGVKQLESLGLISVSKEGRSNIVTPQASGRALWDRSQASLRNPIVKESYIWRRDVPSGALTAGDSFLSAHANLADGLIPTVAMKRSSLAEVERLDARWISEPAEMVRAEEWSYEPCLLGDGRDADPLSVILTFGNTEDERIQGAIDRVLDEVFA